MFFNADAGQGLHIWRQRFHRFGRNGELVFVASDIGRGFLERFANEAALAAVPGVEILPCGDAGPGPTMDTYVFSKATTTWNLYRIPLP